MTSYTLSPVWGAGAQLFDNSGDVLTGGKIYTYEAGTTTPAATYTTPTGNTFNSNPIIANASGRLANEIWLPVSGAYKFVLKDTNDVLIATYDNIPTIPQPPIVNDASSISYEQGYTVTAGAFTVGASYLIANVGTTNFVAIGASANAVGVLFTATGVGSGTGTAKYSRTVQSKLQEIVSVKDFGITTANLSNELVNMIPSAGTNPLFFADGYSSLNDGGISTYEWDATSTATASGSNVIKPTGATTGRWLQLNPTPVNSAVGKFGVYCEDLRGPDELLDPYVEARKIAALGISFAIYWSAAQGNSTYIASDKVSLDALDKAGIAVIFYPIPSNPTGTNIATYAANYVDVPNIVGWYVLDEPSTSATIAQQETAITSMKAVKDLPCFTADNAYSNLTYIPTISSLYDFLLPDIYSAPNQAFPQTPFELSTQVQPQLAAMGTMNRMFPVLGAYGELTEPLNDVETYTSLWADQLNTYKNKIAVFFIWNTGPTSIYGTGSNSLYTISDTPVLYEAVFNFIHGYTGSNQQSSYLAVAPATFTSGVQTYSQLNLQNSLISIFDHPKTTGTVRSYDGTAANTGLYLNNGQFAVIDFGRVINNLSYIATYYNQATADALSFTFYVPNDLTFSTGTTLSTITPTTATSARTNFANLNSRYLVIKSNTNAAANGFVYMRCIFVTGI